MTVKELITELLEIPMDAKVQIPYSPETLSDAVGVKLDEVMEPHSFYAVLCPKGMAEGITTSGYCADHCAECGKTLTTEG